MKFSSSSLDHLNSTDAAAGCISGIIRRLLCGGGLSGRASSLCEEGHVVGKKQAFLSPAPGLVPRLMGLDTMPELPNSVCRSRSTGSLESRPTFFTEQRYHSPRIRPSSSFREVPTFLRKENEEFLVLSFGPESGDGVEIERQKGLVELEEKKMREEMNGENPNRRKRVTEKRNKRNHQLISSRENGKGTSSVLEINGAPGLQEKDDARRKLLLRPEYQKQMLPERTKLGKKNTGYCSDMKAESECSSQDSSPVSVLDSRLEFDKESLINPSTPISGEDLKPVQRNSRRKLSSELENLNSLSSSVHLVLVSGKGGPKPSEEEIKENAKCGLLECSEGIGRIGKLVEEDVKKTNWVLRELWKMEEFEEITVGFELQILDLLLQEAVTELSLLSALEYCT